MTMEQFQDNNDNDKSVTEHDRNRVIISFNMVIKQSEIKTHNHLLYFRVYKRDKV